MEMEKETVRVRASRERGRPFDASRDEIEIETMME